MKKWMTFLMTLVAGLGSVAANASYMGEADLALGYRRDTIDWRNAFPARDPLAKESLQFKDLDIFQISLDGRTTIGSNFYVRANAYWGWILDGDLKNHASLYNEESSFYGYDYNSCFREALTDRVRSTISDQYVFGVGGAIGYPFYFCDCTMLVAPVIGYSFDEQNVQVNQEEITFSCDDYCGSCCEKTFISRWYGPFVGLDFEWRPYNTCFTLWTDVEYHWGHFRGKRSHIEESSGLFDRGNRHSSDAQAWVWALGLDYDLCNCWTVGFSLKFQDWAADRNFHRDCEAYEYSTCSSKAREKNKWRSYAINLTVGREF